MTGELTYIALEPQRVITGLQTLAMRIQERFPASELAILAKQVTEVAVDAGKTIEKISRPLIWVRIGNIFLVAVLIIGIFVAGATVSVPEGGVHFFELVQILEAGINDIILIGAGIYFLVSIETRLKRRRALAALHELRSIAHTIDMLQLTKDPSRVIFPANNTASSPTESLNAFQLSRYLDYCSEMLSFVGKIAALYVEHFDDSVAIGAVNEIELMTSGLSRKIWQKLMILHSEASTSRIALN